MAHSIEDYALIGDGRTAALISREGDLDWLCLPQLDSAASFAALLGDESNGRWSLTVADARVLRRSYVGNTFILRTEYESPTGRAIITEWMPTASGQTHVVRSVECTVGEVTLDHHLRIRFDYGATVPWAHRGVDPDSRHVLRFSAGPDSLTLHSHHLPHGHDQQHSEAIVLTAGERSDFILTWAKSWEPIPTLIDVDASLAHTRAWWSAWCSAAPEVDPLVQRSLLVLLALTNVDSGGIAAAATTSLPEEFGGMRNWDYRFCWLRDSSLSLRALLEFGFESEAQQWRDWLLRAVAGDPENLQIMYGLDGRRYLPEFTLGHLSGYRDSAPVRIGNAASAQIQHDVYGEVSAALAVAREQGTPETPESWSLQTHLISGVIKNWREPDHGIWEIRGQKQHFTHSKVMCWLALDRAISAIDNHGQSGPRAEWVREREEIKTEILTHGIDPKTNSFVQHYGTTEVDASLLMIVQSGFLPPDDYRIIATVERIGAELATGPHVQRYRTASGVDGLPGGEHHFFACSFWLVAALATIGQRERAQKNFTDLLQTANEVGLFAEEYDVVNKRFAGNVPQAFSHLALIQAAAALHATKEP